MSNKIEELRGKLNDLIEKGAKSDEILKISIELDHLIEEFLENTRKNGT